MPIMKNIIFDLGGVVVEWNGERVIDSFKGNPSLIMYIKSNGFFKDYWNAFDKGALDRRELVDKVALITGISAEECNAFVEHVKLSLVPIPETEALIKELSARGYKLYCLSNMSNDFYDYLKTREVFKYFDGQIISAKEHMMKPDREIYELILNRFHLKPEESLFIDDLAANIKAAQALGIQTVHFANKQKGYEEIRERLKVKAHNFRF